MKLAILQNSDVMEKNQCQIRIQRPKISKDLLVLSNAQIFVALCNPIGQRVFFKMLAFRGLFYQKTPFCPSKNATRVTLKCPMLHFGLEIKISVAT